MTSAWTTSAFSPRATPLVVTSARRTAFLPPNALRQAAALPSNPVLNLRETRNASPESPLSTLIPYFPG